MTQVAYISHGYSRYADRLWALAGQLGANVPDTGLGLDYIELLPHFVWAGASVEAIADHPDLHQCSVTVPEGQEEAFYAALEELLANQQ